MIRLETLHISAGMLDLLCEIEAFRGTWNALRAHTSALLALDDVAVMGDTLESVLAPLRAKPLDARLVCRLHAAIVPSGGGAYRTADLPLPLWGLDGRFLETAPPAKTQAYTESLILWAAKALETRSGHPLFVMAIFTALFLQVSPFPEQNQKLCGLLLTWMMLRAGYHYAPYRAVETALQEQGAAFGQALEGVHLGLSRGEADWESWILFFLKALKAQKDYLDVRITGEGRNLGALPELSIRILALFAPETRLSMAQIESTLGESRSTLKLRLSELVRDRYLTRHGKARATWYVRV